ncbi:unnamed protein product [Urochloa decumbens]|uniref:NB-ARC domain-containing protein n=1 Tax=Urochloa decumbens TaxID=240449 RepID=A0ABC9D9S7_9POAL
MSSPSARRDGWWAGRWPPSLEAWAASSQLGPNIRALKMELLYAQGMLDGSQGREIRSPALSQLLQELWQLAYTAEDALDELDYFRIQDELDGTRETAAAASDARGPGAALNARHAMRAVARRLGVSLCWRAASPRQKVGGEGVSDKLASSARHTTARATGKYLPCCSFPPAQTDAEFHMSSDPFFTLAPHRRESVVDSPKLEFYRVEMSRRMKAIVEELKPLCAKVSVILNLELLDSNRSIAHDIVANLSATLLREQGRLPILPESNVRTRPITTSYISEPNFCGREAETTRIKKIITGGKCHAKDLTVVPIVGLGGMGKTTLAQHICKLVEKDFDVTVWMCASANYFSANMVFKEILKSIAKVEDGKSDALLDEELLEQSLKSKRFLLVLDDMWDCCNNDEWDRLLAPFKKGQTKGGNVILVTSRSPVLAQMVTRTNATIELEGLDAAIFWEFFVACIFYDEKSRNDHTVLLETIGRKIVRKLKGSPLAAKTVGRLLRNQLDQNHWKTVLESKEWEMQNDDHDIMPALKLSYDSLPFHLQRCFFYCTLFPKGYKFGRDELIHWWIGLDILQSSVQNKSTEDIGLNNLDDLVAHGFIKKDELRGYACYLIHDLLHDLGLKVASCECLSIDRSNVGSVEIWPSRRHISVSIDDANDKDGLTDENFINELKRLMTRLKIENVQTLMIFGRLDESFVNFFGDLIRKANSLRVLHLSGVSYCSYDQSILHNLPTFSHLRYLSLENIDIWRIHLPSMLSRLYHLRILYLQKWYGSPNFLRDISSLTKLRHIVTKVQYYSEIRNVGKLPLLQELKNFEVNKDMNGFELKQLGNLIELRELGIYHLERVHTKEVAEAKMIHKRHLLKLTLHWAGDCPQDERDKNGDILEGLQPHRNLQELKISGHGGRSCPTWLGSKLCVKALLYLHLESVSWEVLPSLGHMDMIHGLTLMNMSALKEFSPSHFDIITDQNFCNLRMLTLINLRGLEKWNLGNHCHLFSRLEVLIIKDCPVLSGLPSTDSNHYLLRNGKKGTIHWFPSLQELEISDCPQVVSLPPIPWTQSLCSVKIKEVGPSILDSLEYSKSTSNVKLEFSGKGYLQILLDEMLVFNNLTDLQELKVKNCPHLEFKHLQMLTSLKSLDIYESLFLLSESEINIKWQLPVEYLHLTNCLVTGKEMTYLLSHLPKLSHLSIRQCWKITQMGLADTKATSQQQVIVQEVGEIEKVDDGVLLFPTHLADSLRRLDIEHCRELSLVPYPALAIDYETGQSREKGVLNALHSLQVLVIWSCPKFFLAYKIPFSSSSCPFPSSLEELTLIDVEGLGMLKPFSNLTSLTELRLEECGEDLRGEGLLLLITQGQLSRLKVQRCPYFFVGSDLTRGLQDDDEGHLLRRPSKLHMLQTDDVAGVFVDPICRLLSSSLAMLELKETREVLCFTEEQEAALQLLTSLNVLQFSCCFDLQYLPAGLHALTNLKSLQLWTCPAINSLPKDSLPISLKEIVVRDCHNKELKQQCEDLIPHHPEIKIWI